jgi:hypothetical protein
VTARRALAVLLAAVAVAGCTRGSSPLATATPASPPPSVSRTAEPPSPPSAPAGASGLIGPSASRALEKLCPNRGPGGSTAPAEGSAPPIVETIEKRVEQIRGLRFTRSVPVHAVTHDELVRGLRQTFDASYPAALYRRKSLAWATIGAIPAGTQIRTELESFASSQVIGYYDEVSKYLVFLGTNNPSPVQVVTLAHELTHALDDQHFGLLRLDHLSSECDAEGFEAALALTEGDATYVMTAYAQRYLTMQQQLGMVGHAPSTAAIDPFILRLETWPYTAGEAFVQSLVTSGGEAAVDRAFRDLPASTEQILRPASYPNDVPVPVDVPELAQRLGPGWRDLDVQSVGAAWLSILLGLRIDQDRASSAVDGWKGGIYRAWTNGSGSAVELETTWRDAAAASEFASAMRDWVGAGSGSALVEPVPGSVVTVLFASSAGALTKLRSVA